MNEEADMATQGNGTAANHAPNDPPISEADFEQPVRLKSREQRLRTIEVLRTMYGETKSLMEAQAYLKRTLGG